MEILSQFEGMMLIGGFFLAMVAIIFMLRKREQSREEIFRLSKIDRETFLKLVTSRGSQSFSKAQVVRQG